MDSRTNRPKPGQMPSPPEFLLKPQPTENIVYPAMIEEHIPAPLPKNIDIGLYQNALNERKQAEMSAAEIYSQYLEVVSFNQKLLKKQKSFEKFKERVRKVFEGLTNAEGKQVERASRAVRRQENIEGAYNDLQREVQALRASNQAHEEAFAEFLKRIGQAESQRDQTENQFRTLAEELDNRNHLLEENVELLEGYRVQIDQLRLSLEEWHERYSKVRDENLLLQSQMRELQLRESGVAALNEELANSATKAQKQIFDLEDKLSRERQENGMKISMLEEELQRLREQKRLDLLVEKSKKIQAEDKIEPSFKTKTDDEILTPPSQKEPFQDFYNRWSHIINELSSHSGKIGSGSQPKKTAESTSPIQLVSEAGDLEIL